MLYIKPNYYDKFKCIAEKCEATCCAGWQIVIDEESLKRYEKEQSAYGKVLRECIDWEEGAFFQDECKRCKFLDSDNLCDMYKHLGEESLCVTCTNYPRHIEEFENVREITLAISCPEVAHIILNQKEPVTFLEEEVENEEEEFEDFDPFFYSYLEDGRAIALNILQNRAWSIAARFALVQKFAEDMQEIMLHHELFELVDVFEKYEDATFLANAMEGVEKERTLYYQDAANAIAYSKLMFGRLYELEHLSEDWEPFLEQCWQTLYRDKAEGYVGMHREFKKWRTDDAIQAGIDLDIIVEQLLVYFIFTYFCGAVYDDNVVGKVYMSTISVYNIYEMFVERWIEQGKILTMKDIERIVYRYSRELEHSDMNLEQMEEILH